MAFDTSEAKKLKKNNAAGIILNMSKSNYNFFSYIFVIFSVFLSKNTHSIEIINSLNVPNGFKIEVFVDGIDTPRQIAESKSGNIFVGSRNAGTISVINSNKDIRVIAKGLSNSTGVTYHDGDLIFPK